MTESYFEDITPPLQNVIFERNFSYCVTGYPFSQHNSDPTIKY